MSTRHDGPHHRVLAAVRDRAAQRINSSGDDSVLGFIDQIQQIVLTMIRLVMYVAPIGVCSACLAALAGDVGFSVVTTALKYLGTTLLGVLILFTLFVLVVTARTRLSPLKLPEKLAERTRHRHHHHQLGGDLSDGAAQLPSRRSGLSQKVANFTLSIGLTMGSYGALLNYMIVVMFLAQAGDINLSFGQIALGMALAILLNMGTIHRPRRLPVVAMFLATSLGLPFEAVGLLIAVDWFAGIFRTFLNVNGDTFVAMLVANADD